MKRTKNEDKPCASKKCTIIGIVIGVGMVICGLHLCLTGSPFGLFLLGGLLPVATGMWFQLVFIFQVVLKKRNCCERIFRKAGKNQSPGVKNGN